MRVVFWGTSDAGKPRVRILLDGLRANGVEVIECRLDPWQGIQDKSQVRGARAWLRLLARIALAYPRLAVAYLRLPRHDWVLLGYPALIDIFVIRLLAWLRRTPVAMDWFLSAYDTIVLDRGLVARDGIAARAIRALEALAVRLPDRVFMDTAAHARRMEQVFGLVPGSCGRVWVGAEVDAFRGSAAPGPNVALASGRPMRILFYGQFIPLHGTATIIEAARRLRSAEMDWIIIGRGQDAPRIRAMLDADPLPRVHWLEWVDYLELKDHIADADVCLGIFGASDKAASVIPNKAFQVVAAGRPLVTRDSPAIRELLHHAPPCVHLVPPADGAALAEALLALQSGQAAPACPCHGDLVHRIAPRAIGAQLLELLHMQPNRGATR